MEYILCKVVKRLRYTLHLAKIRWGGTRRLLVLEHLVVFCLTLWFLRALKVFEKVMVLFEWLITAITYMLSCGHGEGQERGVLRARASLPRVYTSLRVISGSRLRDKWSRYWDWRPPQFRSRSACQQHNFQLHSTLILFTPTLFNTF